MPELVAAGDGGRTRVRDIRRFWHVVQAPPSLLKRLEPAYYVFITLAIGGPFVYGTASTALSEVATPRAVGIWGPSLALVALLAVMRWGAVQGPVVFSVADITQLLGAPLRRAELVLGRLIRGLLMWTGAAAVVGGLVVVGVAGDHRGVDAVRAAGFVVAFAILGLLGVVGAALVAGSARVDRATRRAAWPIVAVAAGLVLLADSSPTGRHVALWSGPWGWAVQPLAGTAAAWPIAVVLLAALTAAVAAFAVRRRGATPTERHLVRAEARGGAVAAIYSMNARYVRRSLTAVSSGPVSARGANRLKPPRSPRLAIAWRDATAALAVPQRLGEALVLAAGGTVVCLVNGAHPVAVGVGALTIYAGASRLLEPLRAETDQPGRVRVLLRAPIGRCWSSTRSSHWSSSCSARCWRPPVAPRRARCPTTAAPPSCSPCSPPPRSRSAPHSRVVEGARSRRACSRPPTATPGRCSGRNSRTAAARAPPLNAINGGATVCLTASWC